jgi:hypothetical protein
MNNESFSPSLPKRSACGPRVGLGNEFAKQQKPKFTCDLSKKKIEQLPRLFVVNYGNVSRTNQADKLSNRKLPNKPMNRLICIILKRLII